MRRFVLGWKKLGLEQSLGPRLVSYADDVVILRRKGNAETALHHLREIHGQAEARARRRSKSVSWESRNMHPAGAPDD